MRRQLMVFEWRSDDRRVDALVCFLRLSRPLLRFRALDTRKRLVCFATNAIDRG